MLASVNFRVTLPLRAMVIFFINYVESTVFISIKSIAFLKTCLIWRVAWQRSLFDEMVNISDELVEQDGELRVQM